MRYYLFLDESGDHGLGKIDPSFPVFVLCGVLISETNYEGIDTAMNALKKNIWNERKVIFHSRDIRKCEKEFAVLFDLEIKRRFYEEINAILSESDYTIIASAIHKDNYIKRFGRLSDDVYEIALSFIIERAIFWLDGQPGKEKELHIVIERRGPKEDKNLEEHFQRLRSRGTGFVVGSRLQSYSMTINFRNKQQNINGLQLADLVAYPIARHVMDAERANPAFDVLSPKIYTRKQKQYGLKIFP